jgi:hypothetical protein
MGSPLVDRWASLTVLLGLAGSAYLAWLSIGLVASARVACDEFWAGEGFGLLFIVLPITFVMTAIGYGVAIRCSASWPRAPRLLAACVAAGVVALGTAVVQVPLGERIDYAGLQSTDPALAECGPDGVPTWWPTWLPHGR